MRRPLNHWQRFALAFGLVTVLELTLWHAHATGMPDWAFSLNAAVVAVGFGSVAYRVKTWEDSSLPKPRTLVSEADRQTAATLAAQYSSEAQHSLLGWLAFLTATHPVVLAWASSSNFLIQDSDSGALVFGALGILCLLGRFSIQVTQDRARKALHVVLHQTGIGRFARDIHGRETQGWTASIAITVMGTLGAIWLILAGSIFAGGLWNSLI